MTETWDKLPLNLMDELAERESYRRDVYRPIYSLHKWWARRPGSTFRMLGLAALANTETTNQDIIYHEESGGYGGLYLNTDSEKIDQDTVVLDPFSGGGVTHAELNRLGATTVGYELNPVAWWTTKKSIDGVDLEDLQESFNQVIADVRSELERYYTTTDPRTGEECEVLYTFMTQRLPCLSCGKDISLFKGRRLAKNKATTPAVIYCPNSDCDSPIIEVNHDLTDSETCDACGTEFDPSEGNYGYGKYTCDNGHKHDVKETLNRLGKKPEFDVFAIQYITGRGDKKYKAPDEDDKKKIKDSKAKLQDEKESLPIPQQDIPPGDKTQALLNYNYESFSELFTPRQLLTYGKLFKRAKEVPDQNISEFLITAISNSLERNSKLCKWNNTDAKGDQVFTRHAYIPRVQPVEANPLNKTGTLVSVENYFDKVYDAKEYCELPFEKMKNTVTGSVDKFPMQNESISEDRLTSLKCKTAERLNLSDASVDYVITDPPYYDNVQYSELSEYFYVWLRECLKDEYEEFQPEFVPKAREIVANSQQNKDEEFFIESLTNVFSECERVLRDDGEMIFTYHHNENEAWSVILESIIESGFTITGAYPVQSERATNLHIADLDNAEYDIIIFANKDNTDDEITLTELRQNLFFELQDMAAEERDRHEDLGKADLGVILRGKCMYYYSRHYPKVYSEGEQVGIDEALDTVDSIIEQVLEGTVNLPLSIDPVTQAYAAFCQRGREEFDDLNKHLLAKNLNVGDLEDEKLVKGPRDKKEPVTADERITFIEGKLNKNGKAGDELLDIDKVQYLYHLYKTDQNTVEYLKEWKTEELEELADFMADVTGDERYENVMDMGISQF